jgi:predicted ArsR family transcriptional regulator
MTSSATLRRELLRLAAARRHPACISSKRISDFYHVSEKSVRRELANLAEDKVIQLAGWDGRQMRPYSSWQNADEFVDAALADGHFQVDLIARE